MKSVVELANNSLSTKIPFNLSPKLIDLLIDSYSDKAIGFNNMNEQTIRLYCARVSNLLDDSSFETILGQLSSDKKMHDYTFLAMLCWLKSPFQTPPFYPRDRKSQFMVLCLNFYILGDGSR